MVVFLAAFDFLFGGNLKGVENEQLVGVFFQNYNVAKAKESLFDFLMIRPVVLVFVLLNLVSSGYLILIFLLLVQVLLEILVEELVEGDALLIILKLV